MTLLRVRLCQPTCPTSCVRAVRAQDFVPLLQRRTIRAILVGGGSPCQGNSSLNKRRQGLADPRSLQPEELCRIRDEFCELPECQDIPVLSFLENVGSMPSSVRAQYSKWLGCDPVHIDAITCGWVKRNRLFWLKGPAGSVGPGLKPPSDWEWNEADTSSQAVPSLQYVGKKPVPNKVAWDSGFGPLFDPADVLKNQAAGFHPFTREFYHPEDRISEASAQAVDRFFEDHKRFPPSAYEDNSLLWNGDAWRQPFPGERCQIMGLPPSAVVSPPGPMHAKHKVQNSWVGNGFHLPSILVLLCFIPQLLGAKVPPPIMTGACPS